MKLFGITSFAVACLLSSNAFAIGMHQCLAFKEIRGDKCGDPTSLRVDVTNTCNVPIYVKMCREVKDGRWECGSNSNMQPRSTDTGYWTCNATGKKLWSACTGGEKECGFDPKPK